jgi:predicted PurR-regulated permease PerM
MAKIIRILKRECKPFLKSGGLSIFILVQISVCLIALNINIMDQRVKNVIIGLAVILFGFLVYYYSYIVTYILIAAVLSLIGRPLVRKFQQIKIRKFQIGKSGAASLTLLTLWIGLISFFGFLIPLVVSEVDQLSSINMQEVITYLNNALAQLKINFPQFAPNIPIGGNIETYLEAQLKGLLNVDEVSRVFGSLATMLGNIFMMMFSVSFILFFFLKEEELFRNWILVIAPANYESRVSKVMDKVGDLLKRYLVGILFQVVAVMILSILGFTIAGLGFGHAVVVGVFAGILNVIPYIGPWIAAIFGLVVAVANNLNSNFTEVTLPLMFWIIIVVMIVQFVDNMIFQTVIYSNSIKAHALEIFFVILMAGGMAGIPGMILAIPVYTVFRVIAGEFLSEFKIVQQLTPKEEEEK